MTPIITPHLRYLVFSFCAFAIACAGTSPSAPTSLLGSDALTQSGGAAIAQAQHASDLPFKGDLQATETVNGDLHHLIGSGKGTQLGRFTYAADITVDPVTHIGVGPAVWTAANGDRISASTTGRIVFINLPTIGLEETHTITGGTGRFAGASGTIIVERSLDLVTHATAGSFDGAINLGH